MNTILAVVIGVLFMLSVYQFLTQRAAIRISEIIYIMCRHIREKASDVGREGKDVEIVEAHLLDISVSARSLLITLGRNSLDFDPALTLSSDGGNRRSQ